MLEYETRLRPRLGKLPRADRAAFAGVCAERALTAVESELRSANPSGYSVFRGGLDALWEALAGRDAPLGALEERVMEAIPAQNDGIWGRAHVRADNAGSCIAYALRTLSSGDLQEALWAAARNYEAIFELANRRKPDVRDAVALGRVALEREWRRQLRDLTDLMKDDKDLKLLRARAREDANSLFELSTEASQ